MLIALGAQQLVETLRQRYQTKEALRAIRAELSQSAAIFEERGAIQPCIDRRLAQVSAILSEARRSGRLPDIGQLGMPAIRPFQAAAWTMALQNGAVAHLGEEQQWLLAITHSVGEDYSELALEEQLGWATLSALEGSPGAVSEELLAESTITLAQLRYRGHLAELGAEQMAEGITEMRIATDYYMLKDAGQHFDRQVLLKSAQERSICQPLIVDGQEFDA